MEANFCSSSHQKELLDQEEVDVVHQLDKERGITLEDFKLIKLHMSNYIAKLAQNVKLRQRYYFDAEQYPPYLAFDHNNCTGCGYCYYLHETCVCQEKYGTYDPRLVTPTCLYLASKAEESVVQARLLVCYIKKIHSVKKYRYEIKQLLRMEMNILEALNYDLVVFHPYRSLSQLLPDAGMNDAAQLIWEIINDSYKMDLMLIHPPHVIALACILIASAVRDKENPSWFLELRTDMNVVKNIAMEILDFYESFKMITDERVNVAMSKLSR